jgi:Uma2 family endonuclease
MSLPQAEVAFGPEDYLAWEHTQPIRNEYVNGEVFAMSGASDAHGTAAGNLFASLHAHLRGTPCKPFIADMKVHVEAANSFFYPDIVVTCDARDRSPEASHVKRHPVLIVEVLSPSTEAYDRGNKFAAYRTLASLREYVLVSTEQRRIEVFRRDATGHWVLYPFALDEALELSSVDFRCPVAEVFDGVDDE